MSMDLDARASWHAVSRCAFDSLPRRRAPCTSGVRGRHCTTGSWPAAAAASSCSGSRTPTASARPRRTSSRSSTPCAGSSSTGTRSRSSSPSAASATPRSCSSCSTTGLAYRSTAGQDEIKAWHAQHGNRGFRGEDEGEGAVRLRVPDEGATVVRDVIRGEATFENALQDDLVVARADGTPRLPPRGRGRRPRHGHHPRRPRRRPLLQHAEADADPPGDGRGAAASTPTCRCCTAPTARSSPSATAPPRCRSCATRGYLPEAVRNYLALLGWGNEESQEFFTTEELPARFSLERVSKSPGRVRRAEAAPHQRPLPARAGARRPDRAARGAHGPRGPARRGGDLAGEDLDARGLLAARGILLRRARPTIPRRARRSWARRRRSSGSRRRATRSPPSREPWTEEALETALQGVLEPGGEAAAGLPADPRRARRGDRLARDLRDAAAARARRDRSRGSTRPSTVCPPLPIPLKAGRMPALRPP